MCIYIYIYLGETHCTLRTKAFIYIHSILLEFNTTTDHMLGSKVVCRSEYLFSLPYAQKLNTYVSTHARSHVRLQIELRMSMHMTNTVCVRDSIQHNY